MDASPEPSKLYTRDEVKFIVSNMRATPKDYLIRTLFKIFDITQGPLVDKHRRRFNHIIFNNFDEICKLLTLDIIQPKAYSTLKQELSSTEYLSCICPSFQKGPCPVFVQFFAPEKGLQHRVLGFLSQDVSLMRLLTQFNIQEKVVGYCGDYSYRDPANRKIVNDNLSSVRVLVASKVQDLPYADRFLDSLFDLLLDYLPCDPSTSLKKLGETVLGMTGTSHVWKELVTRYKEWLGSDQHILASSFTQYVTTNFTQINRFLQPCQFLPRSVGSLLSSVLHRFFLVFMTELYSEVSKRHLTDNNAIVYYFHLKRLRDLFQAYEVDNFVPPAAYRYYNTEINYLVERKQIGDSDSGKIAKLFKEVVTNVNNTYSRAIKYIEALLGQFDHLEAYSWLLLNDLPLKTLDVQEAADGEAASDLPKEVKIVNSVISKVPLVEIDSVADKWVAILKECQVPQLSRVLCRLLSLPALCSVGDVSGCDYTSAEKTIRVNMSDKVVEDVERIFAESWTRMEKLVQKNKVKLIVD